MDNEHLSTYFTSEHMSELEDFLSEATQPVVVHAMAATVPVFGEGVNGEVAPVLENMDFCRNLCSWMDEECTAASDASTTLDEPFSVNVEKTTVQTGGSRRRRIHAFFKRVWKAIKKPFLCYRRRRVGTQIPQGDPHTNDVEIDLDPEPVPRTSGLQNTVDLNPGPKPVLATSGCKNTVDLNPDPELVLGTSGCKNTVDLNPDPEPVLGTSGCKNTVDLNPDPELVLGTSGCKTTVDLNPDPELVLGTSGCKTTVDLNPDPELVLGTSGCKNTVDLNPDPEPAPGMFGRQFTVDPVPDLEPAPRASGLQFTVNPVPDPESAPRAPGRQFTVDLVPDPEFAPRAPGRQFTVDLVPDPEPVPRASGCQNSVDPVPNPGYELRNCKSQFAIDIDSDPDSDPDSEPVPGPSGLQDTANGESSSATGPNRVFMKSLYRLGDILGTGSFGVTYKAIRKSDGKEVAIKRIRKRHGDHYISVPGYSKPVLREVAFMLMLKDPSKSIYLIEMFEWFDQEGFISLVLEYPKPCTSLRIFVKRRHTLKEPIARCLLHQLILGIQHSLDHGISHNDLHAENILVNTNTLELKVIDFGCASKYEDEEQRIIVLGNIWSVGHLLYFMVNGKVPVYSRDEWQPRLLFKPKISSECCDLIEKCLNHNLETLEEVMQHEWMKKV
ncbi:uncharacterized protein isoform X2 [Danio rerio]|uniref:Uncharacterized protein isoform X2 n=1 Tax=Danio rerio TaxID=7955 RepID=A0AC58G9A1_DANRE